MTEKKMTLDKYKGHRLLIYNCTFTCIYCPVILILLKINDNLYNVGSYKFLTILVTLICAEFIKLMFSSFSSVSLFNSSYPVSSKSTVPLALKELLKTVFAAIILTIIYYIAIVLFGAPFLSQQEETTMLAVTMTTLTLVPAALHLGIDNVWALVNGENVPVNGIFVDAVKVNVKSVLLGTWLGAFVMPLDWDRPWQAWPIPCAIGALTGYVVAHCITLATMLFTVQFSKKIKKTEAEKPC